MDLGAARDVPGRSLEASASAGSFRGQRSDGRTVLLNDGCPFVRGGFKRTERREKEDVSGFPGHFSKLIVNKPIGETSWNS